MNVPRRIPLTNPLLSPTTSSLRTKRTSTTIHSLISTKPYSSKVLFSNQRRIFIISKLLPTTPNKPISTVSAGKNLLSLISVDNCPSIPAKLAISHHQVSNQIPHKKSKISITSAKLSLILCLNWKIKSKKWSKKIPKPPKYQKKISVARPSKNKSSPVSHTLPSNKVKDVVARINLASKVFLEACLRLYKINRKTSHTKSRMRS